MVKKFFLCVFSLFCILSPYIVSADSNYNTDFVVTLSQEPTLSTNKVDTNTTFLQLLENVINSSLSSTHYDLIADFVTTNNGVYSVDFTIIPKGTFNYLDFYSYSSNSQPNHFSLVTLNKQQIGNFQYKTFTFYNNGSPVITNSNFTQLLSCLSVGCDSSLYNYNNGSFFFSYGVTSTSNNSDLYVDFSQHNQNNSYPNTILYYSSIPLKYSQYEFSSSTFYKTLVFNGRTYSVGDILPTYKDLYNPSYTNIEGYDINTILVGNISNLHDFRLNLQFDIDIDSGNMINSMDPYFYVYGRKDNGTYYSYERLDSCSQINGRRIDKTITDNHAIFKYFAQGISCGSLDLTQYDNFYIQLQSISESSGNYYLSNISYYVNQGNFVINNSGYHIYDTFNNLPYDFSFLVTTNESNSNISYTSNNKYVVGCSIDLLTKKISNICTIPGSFGTVTNTGYIVFNMQQYNTNSSNVSIFITEDSILSFGTNGSNSNSSFDYYDNTGTIQTTTIENKLTFISDVDDYNLTNYFDIVNDYINSLSSDINEFSLLVQNFYDSAPVFFQTTIYILFILLCSYVVYLMIRK